jgi:RNA 2',3'-cyclic 3'-phosphodiesterase
MPERSARTPVNDGSADNTRSAESTPQTVRLFLALWPAPPLARAMHAWAGGAAQRPLPAARLHLTLHFLGQVPRGRLPTLYEGLQLPVNPFVLEFADCQRWCRGLLVALPESVPRELSDLHASLGQALRRLDLPVEDRPFRPHVTLSRHCAADALSLPRAPLRWPVRGYVLAQSEPGSRRVYTVLQSFS